MKRVKNITVDCLYIPIHTVLLSLKSVNLFVCLFVCVFVIINKLTDSVKGNNSRADCV
jgi:hypothetical protein